jgi:hypothetical protein
MTPIQETEETHPIRDEFTKESILAVTHIPWFTDYANFVVGGLIPDDFDSNRRKKFLHDCRFYVWDDPFLYKKGIRWSSQEMCSRGRAEGHFKSLS